MLHKSLASRSPKGNIEIWGWGDNNTARVWFHRPSTVTPRLSSHWIRFRSSLLTFRFRLGWFSFALRHDLLDAFPEHIKWWQGSRRSVGSVKEMFQDQRVPYSHFLRWIFAPASDPESGQQADFASHLARITPNFCQNCQGCQRLYMVW